MCVSCRSQLHARKQHLVQLLCILIGSDVMHIEHLPDCCTQIVTVLQISKGLPSKLQIKVLLKLHTPAPESFNWFSGKPLLAGKSEACCNRVELLMWASLPRLLTTEPWETSTTSSRRLMAFYSRYSTSCSPSKLAPDWIRLSSMLP